MKRTFVLAAQYSHFLFWCRENNINPHSGIARYLHQPQQLWGLWYDECEFVYYETWRDNPNASILASEIFFLRAKGSHPEPVQVRSISMEENDNFWYKLTKLDPALFRGLIVAVVALLASIGVAISPALPESLISVFAVVAAIVQALWTRQAVTANARVAVEVPDPVNNPHEVIPGEAVTTASNSEIIAAAKS